MKKPKIYIVGKITKLIKKDPEGVLQKFEKAADKLRELKCIPVNPLDVVNDLSSTWQDAMKTVLPEMLKSDGLYVLPDWEDSDGSNIEIKLALDLQFPVFYNLDELLKHFGKFDQSRCTHPRVRTVLLESYASCETTQSRCEDCGKNLTYPITEC